MPSWYDISKLENKDYEIILQNLYFISSEQADRGSFRKINLKDWKTALVGFEKSFFLHLLICFFVKELIRLVIELISLIERILTQRCESFINKMRVK